MLRLPSILVLLLATGCPGLKRPPPSAQRTQPAPSASPATPAESPADAPATPTAQGVASFEGGVAQVRAAYAAFLEQPTDRPQWEAVVEDLQRVEDEGFVLLDTTQDPRVEDLLLELGDLRASLSEREP